MNIGDKAPEILGLDQDGNEVRLADFAGKRLALYFYPKDSTPGAPAKRATSATTTPSSKPPASKSSA